MELGEGFRSLTDLFFQLSKSGFGALSDSFPFKAVRFLGTSNLISTGLLGN